MGRVFASIDPAAFQRCLGEWAQALVQKTQGRLITMDGKTLGGSTDPVNDRAALHVVSAWAVANHLLITSARAGHCWGFANPSLSSKLSLKHRH